MPGVISEPPMIRESEAIKPLNCLKEDKVDLPVATYKNTLTLGEMKFAYSIPDVSRIKHYPRLSPYPVLAVALEAMPIT